MKLYHYPTCSTCKKALKFLKEEGVVVEATDISSEPPNIETLKSVLSLSGLPIQRLFNVSGRKYKELNLKERLLTMTDEEKLALLASDGMLIKRPLLIGDKQALIGFKEEEWKNL